MKRIVQAGVFKAECLKIMDQVQQTKKPVIVTKHNIPIVRIVPLEDQSQPLFGKMKGTGRDLGDIVTSTGEKWDADS